MLTTESGPATAPVHKPAPSVRNGFWRLVALTTLAALVAYPLFGALLNRVTRDGPTRLPLPAYTSLPTAKEFVVGDARFRAVFPDTPETKTEELRYVGGSATVTMYMAGNAAAQFGVGSFEVGSAPFDLYGGMNGAVDNLKGHLESSELITFAGAPGIEFHFRADGFYGRGMIVHPGSRAYVLLVLNRHRDEPVDYDAFKASFVITP